MIRDVTAYLRCPVCREQLTERPGTLRCARGHAFDIARQGYVNLSTGRSPHTGDTAEMVADRAAFLAAGHYDMITDALTAAAKSTEALTAPGERADDGAGAGRRPDGLSEHRALVVDAGTGTGHYLRAVLDQVATAAGLGLDVSKPALRRAARAHPRAAAALTDLWSPLPLADASAALILNVFAPRHAAEFRRVLRPDGALLVVTPAADHLGELVTALDLLQVDPAKSDRVADQLGRHFTAVATTARRRTLQLTPPEVRTLVGMGPSAWHVDRARLDGAPTTVTASVELTVWR